MELETYGSYAMPFSGPAFQQTMDNLRLAVMVDEKDLEIGAHYPNPDEIIGYIYNQLVDECYKSAMHFSRFRAIYSKGDTVETRLESIHDFFAGWGSKCYINKAISTIGKLKAILIDFVTDFDRDAAITPYALNKEVCIGDLLDYWNICPEKKFFCEFIRDICEGEFYITLKKFHWLAAQIMKPAFKNFYRDHQRVVLGRKKAEARNAYDIRHNTWVRRRKKRKPMVPVVVRLRPRTKNGGKPKPKISAREKARRKNQKSKQDCNITIFTPLYQHPKMLGTIIPALIERMKPYTNNPTLDIRKVRRYGNFQAHWT